MASNTLGNRVLLACDFDHTIMDKNTDTWIWKLLPGGKVPEEITNHFEQHNSWRDYLTEILNFMHSLGITPKQIVDCIKEMSFTPGMKELLRYQSEHDNIDCIILSDSNAVFIDACLEGENLRESVKHVITNPSQFDDSGCLKIKHYHSHDCPLNSCPKNLCKRRALREYIQGQEQGGVHYSHICYVGDGSNDFCPSLTLHEKDFVFPRIGHSLINKIKRQKNEGKVFRAKVIPWKSGDKIVKTLKTLI
ncbi:pyridoxal phosphate phosphatase PHOSPHO2-like isoform X2 [Ptychodera flava]